jgi:uncharacterized protein
MNDYPKRILLALPLTGRNSESGLTVQAGFMAALAEWPESTRPSVVTLDTQNLSSESLTQIDADICVGPLLKSDIEPLLNVLPPRLPVLLLNTLSDEQQRRYAPTRALWQYALRPEDEATSIAQLLSEQALLTGISISLRNEWAERGRMAFASAFTALGGHLLIDQSLDPDQTDLNAFMRAALGLEISTRRKDRIAHISGLKLNFVARPNEQIQFIVYSGPPLFGVQLRQQCRYWYAEHIPMVAFSDIYSENALTNADLNGVFWSDMPWVIQATDAIQKRRQALLNTAFAPYLNKRLFAMGLDAFELGGELYLARDHAATRAWPTQLFDGASGQLSLTPDGHLKRFTAFAQLSDTGNPRPVSALVTR